MGLWRWQGRRTAIWLALEASLVVIGVVVLLSAMHNPSLDREWDEDVRVLAGVALTADGSVTLTGVRDWKYGVDTILAREYFDATFDPADIVDAWMYEQILDDGRGAIAHTFIVFEFDSTYGRARYLGLSVETRREKGEQYSLLAGMLGRFEITHTWATEQDLVARRVLYLDYSLTRYRLQLSPEQRARVFRRYAQETDELAARPRWYNTVTHNCTSSLVQYVNEGRPGALPWHYSWVLTGRMDDYLAERGYLDRTSAVQVTRDLLGMGSLRS